MTISFQKDFSHLVLVAIPVQLMADRMDVIFTQNGFDDGSPHQGRELSFNGSV